MKINKRLSFNRMVLFLFSFQSVHTWGGVPVSHNALQHFPECNGAAGGGGTLPSPAGGGYPARSSRGGTLPGPAGGVPCQVQPGGYPARFSRGGTMPGPAGGGTLSGPAGGGYPGRGGTLLGGVPS